MQCNMEQQQSWNNSGNYCGNHLGNIPGKSIPFEYTMREHLEKTILLPTFCLVAGPSETSVV